jgi:hypothetical protein
MVDDRGHPMLATSAKKNGALYRYYVWAPSTRGRKEEAGSVPRVPAPEIEAVVFSALKIAPEPDQADGSNGRLREAIASRVERIVVRLGVIAIEPRRQTAGPAPRSWCPGRCRKSHAGRSSRRAKTPALA